MPDELSALKPTPVWKHFEKLCSIPRPSGHERAAAAYVSDVCRARGLEVRIDEAGNVIVRKPAAKGMEGRRTVVLQSHLDMVPQKNQEVKHDFRSDPIRPRVDGNLVRAEGTTLGADNGIGIATALAVLEAGEITHGPLEALFTVDEEAGMTGAKKLKGGLLNGDILFNLDSEEEGEICIGCAGGADALVKMHYEEEAPPGNSQAFKVSVSGLKGGHSGVDIHLGRANANKVMNRLLWEARRACDLQIAAWEGGDLRNAIPRWANALVTVPREAAGAFERRLEAVAGEIRAECREVDPDIAVATEKADAPLKGMDKPTTRRLLDALYACPHGVFSMVRDMPTVAETSTNLAIVKAGEGAVSVTNMLRSSVETKKADVANMIRSVFEAAGAEVELKGSYPGWQPDVRSPVLQALKGVYRRKFGAEPKITATHGGLECGIIRSVYPRMEAVSFGPTIRFPHSPDEHVEIPSVQKFWDFLLEALREIPAR